MNYRNAIKIHLKSYDLLESLEELKIPLSDIKLTSVVLEFTLQGEDGSFSDPITIELTKNSKASIPKTKEREIIEQYLKEQGVIKDVNVSE